MVKKQRKASEEVKILLETMPKEAEEVIEKYVDSVFATAIELSLIHISPEHPDDMNEQELFKRAEERTGIHIEWVRPGSSAFNEQKALALASGDMPDIILNGLTDSEIARYGADGTLYSCLLYTAI